MIYQQRREFNQPLWVAYVDLKAASDSVDRTALWQLLFSVGLPHRIVERFKAQYMIQLAVSVLMDVSLSGFRSIAESVRAVLLLMLPMRFWSQWTGS